MTDVVPHDTTTSATATWVLDVNTMSRGRYWHWFKTPWLCWLLPCLGLFVVFASVVQITQEDGFVATPWLLLVLGLYFIFRYWIIGFRFRRNLRKNPNYGKEMKWVFSEDGFQAFTEGSQFKSDWNGLYKTFVGLDGFLLYPQKAIYYWIPRSGFNSDEEANFVESILKQKTDCKTIG